MLTCILGGCGTGKSTRLMEQLRRALEDGKEAIVLVPEQFSFEEEKKLYHHLGAVLFNKMQTYSFATISKHILRTCGGHTEGYATEQEKLLYLYQAVQECLKQKELELLKKRSNSPEFILSLHSVIVKMRKAGISGMHLLEKSASFPDRLRGKMKEFAKILMMYDKILKENGCSDMLEDLTEASADANLHGYFIGKHVFIDEFDSFNGDQYQLLEVMLSQAESVTIAIRADNPIKPPTGIFVGGNKTYYHLRELSGNSCRYQYCAEYRRSAETDLKAVATGILQHLDSETPAEYRGNVRILEGDDPVSEVEYICAECCRLLQENENLHCYEIAVAVKQPEVYFSLLERAMKRYHLPYDLSAPSPVLHTDLVRHFLTLLEILSSEKWNTELLLRYLKSPFSHYALEEVSTLEHFCFCYSIDGENWEVPFFDENDLISVKRADAFGGISVEESRLSIMNELKKLRSACQDVDVNTICNTLYEHLESKKELYKLETEGERTEFVMVWNILMEIMENVNLCHGEKEMPMKELYQNFLLLLQSSYFSTPPQTLNSIRIVDIRTARLNDPKVIFATGVLNTVYPEEVQISGMFSNQELREMEEYDIKISRLLPELHSDELLIINKVLASASERLYLTYPIINAEHETAMPALLIHKIKELFSGSEVMTEIRNIPLSFYVRTMESAYFHFVRNLRNDTPELSALREVLETDETYKNKIEKLIQLQTEPNLTVSPETMKMLLSPTLILSPSGIEQYHKCAYEYFCQYVLKLYVPERIILSPLSAGDYAHYCLEIIFNNMESIDEFLAMTPEMLREKVNALSEQFSKERFPDAVRKNGRFQFNYRVAGNSLLDLLMHMKEQFQKEKFRPAGYEVPFTEHPKEGEFYAYRVGEDILCKGKIDRVDRWHEETLNFMRVVDYKTGTKTLAPEKLISGLDMQMLIYLFALQQNQAYDNATAGGVLYMPSGQPKSDAYFQRGETNSTREQILDEFYQKKGLVLDSIVEKLDMEEQRRFKTVFDYDENDHLFKVTPQQMEILHTHVENTILQMGQKLREGEISPNPYLKEEYSPCGRCGFADVCGKAQTECKKLNKKEKQEAVSALFGESPKEKAKKDKKETKKPAKKSTAKKKGEDNDVDD